MWIGTNNCLAMDGSLERITHIMYSYDPHLASVRAKHLLRPMWHKPQQQVHKLVATVINVHFDANYSYD